MRSEETGARGQGPAAGELQRMLRALAAQDRQAEAPEDVESRVMARFRRYRRRRTVQRGTAWSLLAAAAVAAVVVLVPASRTPAPAVPAPLPVAGPGGPEPVALAPAQPEPAPSPVRGEAPAPDPQVVRRIAQAAETTQPGDAVPPTGTEPVVLAGNAAQPAAAPESDSPREVVTDFFPLMDVIPPMDRGQIWRVTVPASTLRTVGLPVSPERWGQRIPADLLVGEEGMARAIRFVSYEQ